MRKNENWFRSWKPIVEVGGVGTAKGRRRVAGTKGKRTVVGAKEVEPSLVRRKSKRHRKHRQL